MVSGVKHLEPLAGNVSVYLRGRDVAVPEQHLDNAQVRAVIEQVGGERMSQRVR